MYVQGNLNKNCQTVTVLMEMEHYMVYCEIPHEDELMTTAGDWKLPAWYPQWITYLK